GRYAMRILECRACNAGFYNKLVYRFSYLFAQAYNSAMRLDFAISSSQAFAKIVKIDEHFSVIGLRLPMGQQESILLRFAIIEFAFADFVQQHPNQTKHLFLYFVDLLNRQHRLINRNATIDVG